ncbi:MAG: hypothetical protein U1E52_14070 [Geminicoccaceae bacterium]
MSPVRPLALLVVLPLAACAPLDRTSGDRALTGTAVGAAAGAAVGLLGGGLLGSTVTGAVAGAAGGLVYDQMRKSGH